MRIGTEHTHLAWDNSIEPVAELTSGACIEVALADASGGQLSPTSTDADVARLDLGRVNPVTGPIRLLGAAPGDAVAVRIVELDVADRGWTALIPGFGLLAEDFPEPTLVQSRTAQGQVMLGFGPTLPAIPMIGTLGVALPEAGAHPLLPPSRFGGNMDIRHVTAGATVYLPVGVDGALLSLGDTHATMGDGEVCGTGVETAGRALLEVQLRTGAAPPAPVIETAANSRRAGAALATTGIGPDLMRAARDATRSMIDEVVRRSGLSPAHAYLLASLTGDLVISEIVDAPNWVVSMQVPLAALH